MHCYIYPHEGPDQSKPVGWKSQGPHLYFSTLKQSYNLSCWQEQRLILTTQNTDMVTTIQGVEDIGLKATYILRGYICGVHFTGCCLFMVETQSTLYEFHSKHAEVSGWNTTLHSHLQYFAFSNIFKQQYRLYNECKGLFSVWCLNFIMMLDNRKNKQN